MLFFHIPEAIGSGLQCTSEKKYFYFVLTEDENEITVANFKANEV